MGPCRVALQVAFLLARFLLYLLCNLKPPHTVVAVRARVADYSIFDINSARRARVAVGRCQLFSISGIRSPRVVHALSVADYFQCSVFLSVLLGVRSARRARVER